MLSLHFNAKNTRTDITSTPKHSPWLIAFLFPAIVSTVFCFEHKPEPSDERMSQPLQINEKELEDALTTSQTYKILLIYGETVQTICFAVSGPHTGTGVNLVQISLISTGWGHRDAI